MEPKKSRQFQSLMQQTFTKCLVCAKHSTECQVWCHPGRWKLSPIRCSRLVFFYLFTYLGIYLFILTSFKYSARLVTYSSWKAFHTCIVPLKCSSGTFYTRLLTFIGHCFTNLRKKQDSPSWVHVYGLENGVKREVIKWELSVLFGNTWYLNL